MDTMPINTSGEERIVWCTKLIRYRTAIHLDYELYVINKSNYISKVYT